MFLRDSLGLVRSKFKQFVRDHEWRPTADEGPPHGHRVFKDEFNAQAQPQLTAQSMTAIKEADDAFKFLYVSIVPGSLLQNSAGVKFDNPILHYPLLTNCVRMQRVIAYLSTFLGPIPTVGDPSPMALALREKYQAAIEHYREFMADITDECGHPSTWDKGVSLQIGQI